MVVGSSVSATNSVRVRLLEKASMVGVRASLMSSLSIAVVGLTTELSALDVRTMRLLFTLRSPPGASVGFTTGVLVTGKSSDIPARTRKGARDRPEEEVVMEARNAAETVGVMLNVAIVSWRVGLLRVRGEGVTTLVFATLKTAGLSDSMSSSMAQRSLTTRVVDTRRAARTAARTTLVVKVRALLLLHRHFIRARAANPPRQRCTHAPRRYDHVGVGRGGSCRMCARSAPHRAFHFRGDLGAPPVGSDGMRIALGSIRNS